ncbi:hypothetical protein OBBRIDRAFT_426855 [Obba rivulosa]|uniref:Uncharacterized protein n=1 Tax=Obba rivulosa TaxID=1052685 RepID=A0A8E2AX22_9APHY|nr:hypothetical protein OBBRIDRAFT_426855 [Obba rivulosa]
MSQAAIIAGVIGGVGVPLVVITLLWVRIRRRNRRPGSQSSWIGTRIGNRIGTPQLVRGWVIDQFNEGRSTRSQNSATRYHDGYPMSERVLSITRDESSSVLPPSPPAQYAERRESMLSAGSDTPTPSSAGSEKMLMAQPASERPRPPRPLPPVPRPRQRSSRLNPSSPVSNISRREYSDTDSERDPFFKGEVVQVQAIDDDGDREVGKGVDGAKQPEDSDARVDSAQTTRKTQVGPNGDRLDARDRQEFSDRAAVDHEESFAHAEDTPADPAEGEGPRPMPSTAEIDTDPLSNTAEARDVETARVDTGDGEGSDFQSDSWSDMSDETDMTFPSSLELDNLEAGWSQEEQRPPGHTEPLSIRPLPVIPVIAIPRNSLMVRDEARDRIRDRTVSTPASFIIPVETPVDDVDVWTPSRRSIFFHTPFYHESGAASPSKRSSKASSIKSLSRMTARMSSASASLIVFPRRWSRVDRIDPQMRSSVRPVTPRTPDHPPLPFPLDSRVSSTRALSSEPVGRTASTVDIQDA